MWCPDETHPSGESAVKDYTDLIAELELGVDFGQVTITDQGEFDSIEARRTHTQMQIALVEIGNALNFRTWIAQNDHHIVVKDVKRNVETRLGAMPGVIPSLDEMPILYTRDIKRAAALIDCIWFSDNGNRIPAIIEVEHSTGVTSGLTRMLKFNESAPSITTTVTIIAPNDQRDKVVREANSPVFRKLGASYMPYSTVRELYGLIQKYPLSNVVDYRFIGAFFENVVGE
jgi:type II restriction enzyme